MQHYQNRRQFLAYSALLVPSLSRMIAETAQPQQVEHQHDLNFEFAFYRQEMYKLTEPLQTGNYQKRGTKEQLMNFFEADFHSLFPRELVTLEYALDALVNRFYGDSLFFNEGFWNQRGYPSERYYNGVQERCEGRFSAKNLELLGQNYDIDFTIMGNLIEKIVPIYSVDNFRVIERRIEEPDLLDFHITRNDTFPDGYTRTFRLYGDKSTTTWVMRDGHKGWDSPLFDASVQDNCEGSEECPDVPGIRSKLNDGLKNQNILFFKNSVLRTAILASSDEKEVTSLELLLRHHGLTVTITNSTADLLKVIEKPYDIYIINLNLGSSWDAGLDLANKAYKLLEKRHRTGQIEFYTFSNNASCIELAQKDGLPAFNPDLLKSVISSDLRAR